MTILLMLFACFIGLVIGVLACAYIPDSHRVVRLMLEVTEEKKLRIEAETALADSVDAAQLFRLRGDNPRYDGPESAKGLRVVR